jgi:hypothetical protein
MDGYISKEYLIARFKELANDYYTGEKTSARIGICYSCGYGRIDEIRRRSAFIRSC